MAGFHTLKTWPEHFDAIERGEKTFEVRKDDRGFAVGDLLVLQRYDPVEKYSVGEDGLIVTQSVTVSHLLNGGQFGIEPGHVVMAISRIGT